MFFNWLEELFERNTNVFIKYKQTLENSYSLMAEILNTIFDSMKDNVGIGNSRTGWYKPNVKHINTSNNFKRVNYRNYKLRNIARFPRETYYRIRRK